MGLLDKAHRMVTAKAQAVIDEPVIAAANFHWMVTWATPSSARNHPERAGDLPETIVVALTSTKFHILVGEVSAITHDIKSGAELSTFGTWERTEVTTTRVSRERNWLGWELPDLYSVQFDIPGHPPSQMAGLQGATKSFLAMLRDPARQTYK